jgi:membrane protein required for colicin V production
MITNFNTFDLALLTIIVIFGLVGFGFGITRMLLGIAGWSGAVFFTFYAYVSNGFDFIRPSIKPYITDPLLMDLVIGVGMFIFFVIILGFLNRSISTYIKKSILGSVDRSLGLLFGFSLAVCLLSFAFLLTNLLSHPKDWPHVMRSSRSVHILAFSVKGISRLLPKGLLENLGLDPEKITTQSLNKTESLENFVKNLSRPLPSSLKQKEDDKKSHDYKKEQVTEMDRLFENNE